MIPSAALHPVALFAVLTAVFAYLYGQQRERRFVFWGSAWIVLFTRQVVAFQLDTPVLAWLWFDQVLVLFAATLVFLGGLDVVVSSTVRRPRRNLLVAGVSVFVAAAAVFSYAMFPEDRMLLGGLVGLAGAMWIVTGWLVERYGRERTPTAAPIVGVAFVVWGFALPASWFLITAGPLPFWWPVIEFALNVTLALGMILLAVDESRLVFSPRSILDEDPNMVAVVAGGRFVFVNRAMERRTGWEQDALSAAEREALIAPESRDFAESRLQSILIGGEIEGGYEIEILDADQRRIPVMVFADRISWEGRRAVKLELIDLTEQRQAEAEIRSINTELQTINRELEASSQLKSEFLSNTSHELKTPLTSIIANTEILEYEMCGPVNEEQRRILSSIGRNSQHLLDMISQLLDFARQEEGGAALKYEKVDLEKLIAAVVETVQPLDAGGRDIVTEFDERISPCYLDGEKIYRVYLNLVENALKFSKEGEIRVSAHLADDEIEGAVTDEGIGIPEEMVGQVFEAFRQVDASATRSYQGVGLGLAITRQIVELHGGRIWAESEFGSGTTMRFRLPYRTSPPAPIDTETSEVTAS